MDTVQRWSSIFLFFGVFGISPVWALNVDSDGDGISDHVDNCPSIHNVNQINTDNDSQGDDCDGDLDGDGIENVTDNCPSISNADQADADGNTIGDACDALVNNDLDIFKPKHKSSIANYYPTVYFRYDVKAEGYLVDLVGPNTAHNVCNGLVAYQGYIQRAGSDCIAVAGNNMGGITGGDGKPDFPPNVETRVCEWKAPTSLKSGWYAVSITGFDQNLLGVITKPGTQDSLVRDTHCETRYQHFDIQNYTPRTEVFAVLTPDFGISCDANTGTLNGGNCLPVVKSANDRERGDPLLATWLQLYINDSDGDNLTKQWYRIGNGANEVSCSGTVGHRTCEFPDITSVLAAGEGLYTWWVRSWSTSGPSSWSAAASMTD